MLEILTLLDKDKNILTMNQVANLLASDGTTDDRFGHVVSVSGDGNTIVIGAQHDDGRDTNSGSIYIFKKYEDGTITQFQKLSASDGAYADQFGYSVTISEDGSTIVANGSGSVYIFN